MGRGTGEVIGEEFLLLGIVPLCRCDRKVSRISLGSFLLDLFFFSQALKEWDGSLGSTGFASGSSILGVGSLYSILATFPSMAFWVSFRFF